MKGWIGIAMIAVGIALGLYVGVWVCFIGGIVDVITEIRADELIALNVAIGVAKVFLAGLAGWISGATLVLPGYVMIK